MKSLVLYDSQFCNTEKIARTIADVLGAVLLHVSEAKPVDFESLDILVAGSPTQGGMPTKRLQQYIGGLPAGSLKHTRIAAFDTRMSPEGRGFFLRTLMRVIDYASPRILKNLEDMGGKSAVPPEGFIVKDKEGPLENGELDRSASWAKGLIGEGHPV